MNTVVPSLSGAIGRMNGSTDRQSAFDIGEVYESERPRLVRLAAGMGLAMVDAEDALHDCYAALLERKAQLPCREDAQRWLTRVMVNRSMLHHRSRYRWRKVAAACSRLLAMGSQRTETDEELLRRVLMDQPPEDRAMLVLRYFCEMDSMEIGKVFEMPAATIRSRVHRARLELGERLLAKGFEP